MATWPMPRSFAAIFRSEQLQQVPRGGRPMPSPDTSWLAGSIMAQRGLAKGQPGQAYMITEADQGTYHYVYGPYAKPILTVDPGAVVSAETHDAFEGKITSESDRPTQILNFPYLNPQNG